MASTKGLAEGRGHECRVSQSLLVQYLAHLSNFYLSVWQRHHDLQVFLSQCRIWTCGPQLEALLLQAPRRRPRRWARCGCCGRASSATRTWCTRCAAPKPVIGLHIKSQGNPSDETSLCQSERYPADAASLLSWMLRMPVGSPSDQVTTKKLAIMLLQLVSVGPPLLPL